MLVNTEGAGRGTLTAVLKSKTYEAPLLIERQARFLYRCAFLAQSPGTYDLIIKWGNDHIPGSPFTVSFLLIKICVAMVMVGGGGECHCRYQCLWV